MKLDKITARGVHNLYRHPVTKIIYYRKYSDGKEAYKSTRTKDLDDAKKEADRIARKVGSHKGRRLALELYDSWIARKEALNKASNTITSIKASRNFFENYIDMMYPEEITAEWWESVFIPETKFLRFKSVTKKVIGENGREEYKRVRVQVKRSVPRKFANDWKWLSSFLKQLAADGVIEKQPHLINPDPERDPGKVYADEEIETLIGLATTEDLRLAIEMAVTMGMRRLEIFNLRSDRIDIDAGVIRLKAQDTKIRKARSFSISPQTRDRIYMRAVAGPCVFPSKDSPDKPLHKDGYMTAWRNLKGNTGIDGKFHWLRHTFLTKAFKAPGANPALICFYAGLSLEEAQRTYLHFDEKDTEAVAGLVTYG